jgi:hypothetical protein
VREKSTRRWPETSNTNSLDSSSRFSFSTFN